MIQVMEPEEFEELTDILAAAEELDSRLTPWETMFITEFQDRTEKWGRKIRVSERQWHILRRIKEKL